MTQLNELIDDVLDLSMGLVKNEEIIFLYDPEEKEWIMELGNPSTSVRLGETEGEYKAEGDTITSAVLNMESKLKEAQEK